MNSNSGVAWNFTGVRRDAFRGKATGDTVVVSFLRHMKGDIQEAGRHRNMEVRTPHEQFSAFCRRPG
jgi:hypothetical protein